MAKGTPTIIDIASIKVACGNCTLRELCLPIGLSQNDVDSLDSLINRRRTLKKGEMLYRVGDPLRALYAVKRGSLKTSGLLEDGRTQVAAFYLPGELLGFDAITAERHPCSAEALEGTEICEIPYFELEGLCRAVPGLQHQLLRVMSREIVRDEEMLMVLGRMTAEERLASCLLSFSQRYARLGLDGRELKLSMSRQDLGDYLGLALETVSRLFSRLQESGVISSQGRHVYIEDPRRLEQLAGRCADGRSARA
jgi:CRP/FNR family transcriptional regulator, anaerobic regulatory protein